MSKNDIGAAHQLAQLPTAPTIPGEIVGTVEYQVVTFIPASINRMKKMKTESSMTNSNQQIADEELASMRTNPCKHCPYCENTRQKDCLNPYKMCSCCAIIVRLSSGNIHLEEDLKPLTLKDLVQKDLSPEAEAAIKKALQEAHEDQKHLKSHEGEEPKSLDEAIQFFKGYIKGENGFDELDFKTYVKFRDGTQEVSNLHESVKNKPDLKCGHAGIDWDGKGNCITCTRDRLNLTDSLPLKYEWLDDIFPCDCGFMKGFAFKEGDSCDGTCVLAPYKKKVQLYIDANYVAKEKIK